ncbi:MAG: LysM peptidoglycan-binding domain-containing protein, partial [Deltaproteobacteria bacterium]
AATPVPKARSRARVRHAVVTHRVKHGQTLTHIAHAHRVSVASLRNVNRLGKRSVLRPGQRLRIPVAENAT